MNEEQIQQIIHKQKSYFQSGATLPVSRRIDALRKLKAGMQAHEEELYAALKQDLGKSRLEAYMCEIGLTYSEITYMLKHIRSFAKEKRVRTPLAQYVSRSYVKPVPYGTVLIMSPWNYPLLLTLEPLVDALAAGNTCIVKPSAYSPATTAVLEKLIHECFSEEYVAVVTGGRKENACLLKQHFDYVFFTGSQNVGKEVLRQTAEHLTPVTLELGGKSPCVVDASANLKTAARRIVFGKFLNCGQTCVAPDYLYCQESIKDELLSYIKAEMRRQFGEHPLENPNYGKIINEKHFQRVCSLINPAKTIAGGAQNPETLQIEPTLMDHITWDDPVMQEEIFGPILPVLTYSHLDDLIPILNAKQHPLAAYFFSSRKDAIKKFTSEVSFGGGCVNDTVIHLATSHMGFGGVGESGMGAYHGKTGFDTFSHRKSIVDKKTWLDLPMRYQPYQKIYDKMVQIFLK